MKKENYKFIRLSAESIEKVATITKDLKDKTGKFYSREYFIDSLIKSFGNLNRDKILKEYRETVKAELDELDKLI